MRVARLRAGQNAFPFVTTVQVRSHFGLLVLDRTAWTAHTRRYPES